MSLFVFAAMIALTVIYFNDVGLPTVLKFWGAFLLGLLLTLLPFAGAGYLMLAWQALVAGAFWIKAKSSV